MIPLNSRLTTTSFFLYHLFHKSKVILVLTQQNIIGMKDEMGRISLGSFEGQTEVVSNG